MILLCPGLFGMSFSKTCRYVSASITPENAIASSEVPQPSGGVQVAVIDR
jgi:hypothetical protein